MDLEHGLTAEFDFHNPTVIVVKGPSRGATALITKDSNGNKAIIWLGPSSEETKAYIKGKQRDIENEFGFNSDLGDEIGIEKFETCSHRSETEVDSVVATCCSSKLVTGYKCFKRGFPRVLPSICKNCGDYLKK